jgi:hypothetical protein
MDFFLDRRLQSALYDIPERLMPQDNSCHKYELKT